MASNVCIPATRTTRHSHVEALLPRLRRHAVMLAGSRQRGDETVAVCLQAYRRQPGRVRTTHAQADLFRLFHSILGPAVKPAQAGASGGCADSHLHLIAADTPGHCADTVPDSLRLLETLTSAQRRVLTLVSVEGFTVKEAADILGMAAEETAILLDRARKTLLQPTAKPQDGPVRRIKEA